ncbi:MAG: WYL domain-containing protein [Nevskiales bacterium]
MPSVQWLAQLCCRSDCRCAKAKDVARARLDRELSGSYGIFSGKATDTAVLCFSAERARWVADEQWHPEQQGCWRDDGRYELRLPYHHGEELLMDILRHGEHVEVLGPEVLRESVAAALKAATATYA